MHRRGQDLVLGVLVWLAGLTMATAQVAPPERVTLGVSRDSQGRMVCESRGPADWVQELERSGDLKTWTEVGRTLGGWSGYPVETPESGGFFRVRSRPRAAEDDWKNQVALPDDPLMSGDGAEGASGLRWVKFCILLDAPRRVYFQDSKRYLFHHGFATSRLSGFEGMSPEAFDAVSLTAAGQRVVLGAVVLPGDGSVAEAGIQLVGREPFPMADVVRWLEAVRDALVLPGGWSLFYLPAFEQGVVSVEDRAFLGAHGFPVGSPTRWVRGDECYSAGWAYGRLRWVPAGEIAAAFAAGRLRHEDVLLTDAVPAEIPVVAGTLTTLPATPNSHVAILAQSLGLPFAYVSAEEVQDRLRSWEGQEVLVQADRSGEASRVQVLNVDGVLSEAQARLLREARRSPPLNLEGMAVRGRYHLPISEVGPSDRRYVGGKAANFSVLSRSLPDQVPTPSLAFTFDLWNAYLDRPVAEGGTLRSRVRGLLSGYSFPPDAERLSRDLAMIRGWIRDEVDFGEAEKTAILEALVPFPTGVRIRFRSSTNVEDSEQFSGAGLYDSYSGCVLDDLDGDTEGPSHCDPTESGERGVFRALRRVFASFYNGNAVFERLRHGVDESTVGMAVLVHPSFSDETELANGVATMRVRRGEVGEPLAYDGEWVHQSGAVSVSNPEGNARPEVVAVTRDGVGEPRFQVRRRSSLVPLGGTVLAWPADYTDLQGYLERATEAFVAGTPGRKEWVLDFETKKVVPGRLVVKQVREVPVLAVATNPPPFVLNDAGRLVVFQHHGKDLMANHRLKSIWEFQSLAFSGEAGSTGFDFFAGLQRQDGTGIREFRGRLGTLSNAVITVSGDRLSYGWTWPEGLLRGDYRMVATFSRNLNASAPTRLSDAVNIELGATYREPQPTWDAEGRLRMTTTEKTRLVPLESWVDGRLERRAVARQGRVTVEIEYTLGFLKFGVPGVGIFDGKSFPLVRWRGTRISGLTPEPIRLEGEFSQTYDSIRHNFVETFLFEPGLEPGLDPGALEALRAANIRRIRVEYPSAFPEMAPRIELWGEDNQIRPAN